MKTRGVPSEARAWLSVSACTKEYSCSSSAFEETAHVSTNEYRLKRQTVPRVAKCPDLDLNSFRKISSPREPSQNYSA